MLYQSLPEYKDIPFSYSCDHGVMKTDSYYIRTGAFQHSAGGVLQLLSTQYTILLTSMMQYLQKREFYWGTYVMAMVVHALQHTLILSCVVLLHH